MTYDILILVVGLALLVGAGDALVRGAVALSLRLEISAVLVSVTIVGFGTSAPELLIAIQAALADSPGIALGNVVGSNIANVLLVLGLPAMIVPIAGCGPEAHRNLIIMLAVTALFSAFAMTGLIGRLEGLALVIAAAAMVWDSIRSARKDRPEAGEQAADGSADEIPDEIPGEIAGEIAELGVDPGHISLRKTILFLVVGIVGLPVGAQLLIDGARDLARDWGISEAAIGVTIVAVGTSLPELATSVMAALRRHADVAIGNVIGSNIFNITAIAGAAALVHPLAVPAEIIQRDLWFMIGTALLLAPLVLYSHRIGRRVGAAFVATYVVYGYLALGGAA